MTTKTIVTCDLCDADLTETDYQSGTYLALVSRAKRHRSGFVYATWENPVQVPDELNFCNLNHLLEHFGKGRS